MKGPRAPNLAPNLPALRRDREAGRGAQDIRADRVRERAEQLREGGDARGRPNVVGHDAGRVACCGVDEGGMCGCASRPVTTAGPRTPRPGRVLAVVVGREDGVIPDNVDGERPDVGPAYGGSADAGVVSSVGEHDPAAGDVVEALTAEHAKLQRLLDEVQSLAGRGDYQTLRVRWGGIVRELLEHEVAQTTVALPAAERVEGTGATVELRRRSEEVVALLREHDAFTPDDVALDRVTQTAEAVREHLRTMDDVLLPLLAALPADDRARLGEDLRQVMG